MRRRELLAGALGVGAALVTGPSDPAAALEAALFEPRGGSPLPPARLHAALAAARADFAAARYTALGEELPALIASAEATRDAATGRARENSHTTVARSYVLATELAVKQHAEFAWATADRALNAARASGDPVVISEAARVLAITMRRAGRGRSAVDLLTRTATSLGAETGTPPPEALAARTCLLLTAAYTAASSNQRGTALDLLHEAEESAHRIARHDGRPLGLFTISASPAECTLYRISAYNALGTPDEGIPHVSRINPAQLPNPERRARYWTDTARMWHRLGDARRTYGALRTIERETPEEVRRPALQALTADLLYTPLSLPGLKEFAARTGAARRA